MSRRPAWITATFVGVALIIASDSVPADGPAFHWNVHADYQYYTLMEGDLPVLRYNFGNVPMPAGVELKHFPDGRPYGGERSQS